MPRIVQQVKFPPMVPKRIRVAAYARVSNGKDAMLHSLVSQVEYYSSLIRSTPGWEYAGVYRKGADGLPEIVPEEAEIVRSIYRMFMAGKNPTAIARSLTQQKIPTPGGKENWQSATVESILRNEKYKGSALLQKRYTVDFLTKTMKVNEGEVPQGSSELQDAHRCALHKCASSHRFFGTHNLAVLFRW